MSAFCPLSKKVFGNARIDRGARHRLLVFLVLSRLLYNVHVWSSVPIVAYAKMNAFYMRGLRRIAEAQRFQQSGHGSDEKIRLVLRAPSLQCLILRRRMLLLSSVARHAPPFLTSLLAARDSSAVQCLPWVRLVVKDLKAMYMFHEHKLQDLGDPGVHTNADKWFEFARAFPVQWKQLVNRVFYANMPMDKSEHKSESVDSHVCTFACAHFPCRFCYEQISMFSHEQSIISVLHLILFCLSLLFVPSAGYASRLVLALWPM